MLERLDRDVVMEVLKAAGAEATCAAARCCRDLAALRDCAAHRKLWRFFFETSFNLAFEEDDDDDDSNDWRGAYVYVLRTTQRSGGETWLGARATFADDGGHIAGYPAQNALSRGPECWCTRPGVDRNVDLVAELEVPSLVTAFRFSNPEAGFTMPLRDALAFASFDVPDLSKRRDYDANSKKQQRIVNGETKGAAGVRFDLDALARAARGSTEDVSATRECGPTMSNFVHFKLLSSYHPDGATVNIDVRHLHVRGFPLPDLPTYLRYQKPRLTSKRHRSSSSSSSSASYERLHPDAGGLPGASFLSTNLTAATTTNLTTAEQGLDTAPEVIRMMIVTTSGVTTHMPIHLAALHPTGALRHD